MIQFVNFAFGEREMKVCGKIDRSVQHFNLNFGKDRNSAG